MEVKPKVVELFEKNKMILSCLMSRTNLATGEDIEEIADFHSLIETNLGGTNEGEMFDEMVERILENLANFQRQGSNWRFEKVVELEIYFVEFNPLRGSSWIKLPDKLKGKKAIVNLKNEDQKCLKWCITRALNPVENHPERITEDLRNQSVDLCWRGIDFPVELDKIGNFERRNMFLLMCLVLKILLSIENN